jgi:alanine-glyoxylate transaminase/serine-glyoxylate transaminase/serine-pyruvate transaminase
MVTGVLSGVEMGLRVCGIPHRSGGIDVAMSYLSGNAGAAAQAAE